MRPSTWSKEELERAHSLAARLEGSIPVFAVRAPGRVNLIGEHTDYSNLPVLPIAIDHSTIIVTAARDDHRIEVRNADSQYRPRGFALARKIPRYPEGDWANYLKAA